MSSVGQKFWNFSSTEDFEIKHSRIFLDDPFYRSPLLVGEEGANQVVFIQGNNKKKS